jgi:hypothetical protein
MKRTTIILSLIFALAIALSVSIPTLAVNPDTTTITGTVGQKIELNAPDDFTLNIGTMEPGNTVNGSSSTNGWVKCNKGWSVTANNSSGRMVGPMSLTNKINIQLTGGSTPGAWADATTGSTTSSLTKPAGGNSGQALTLNAGQLVDYLDAPGVYTIIITLTASIQ